MGNPGSRYRNTRHNIGFQVIDRILDYEGITLRTVISRKFQIGRGHANTAELILVKPLTFMNRSGDIMRQVLRRTSGRIEELLVICDSLDLPVGTCRLKLKGSSAGQKGLDSIIRYAGTSEIRRIFVGIGRPENREDVVPYVLSRPQPAERDPLADAVRRAARGVVHLLNEPLEKVMNEINRPNASPDT